MPNRSTGELEMSPARSNRVILSASEESRYSSKVGGNGTSSFVPQDDTTLHRRRRPRDGWRVLAAVAAAALFMAPIAFMFTTSLRQIGIPLSRQLEVFPQSPSWDNYPAAFDLAGMGQSALNSALVVALAVPLTILVASLAGFAMSQLPQRPRLILTLMSFAVLMTPVTAVWLPRFVLFKEAGLLDSRLALVVPALGGTSPFFVLLFLWTFLRVPTEIYESARLDGAGALRLWAGIAMPLARPTIVAIGMLAFVTYWGNFIDPLLYLRSPEKMTLPYSLQMLYQLDATNWPLLMAGSVLVTAPVVMVFVVAQRSFLQQFREQGWLGR
ncbi:MAG TPA: carbohydrate ABC transporter permease [Thermomicrobiales bacterium]|nr:carbohydrate ABC transporter permease [Thermomicrobiales bacterium]